MEDLQARVAIITGAANGIGRATAETFARAGYHVAAWDLDEQAGAELIAAIAAAGGSAEFARVDVRSSESVATAVAHLIEQRDRIDVLINNAGILRDALLVKVKHGELIASMSDTQFDAVIDVNLKGVFVCARAVAPHMIARGYGRIVNASSVVGLYGNFGQTNYVAAKSGVIGMTKVWARELGRHGITVNAVAPGFIATGMVEQMPPRALSDMVSRTPVGRIGEPFDIARAYLFLADPASSFINGTVLSVDGGMIVGS
ncbi:MAG TPA: 3-oxoacyl-ACP reductase FabG [Enhygromyxa sp.]|nr:3-oxoacyl-ACP reductase FabG [Enhygromyxa sp.]